MQSKRQASFESSLNSQALAEYLQHAGPCPGDRDSGGTKNKPSKYAGCQGDEHEGEKQCREGEEKHQRMGAGGGA